MLTVVMTVRESGTRRAAGIGKVLQDVVLVETGWNLLESQTKAANGNAGSRVRVAQ